MKQHLIFLLLINFCFFGISSASAQTKTAKDSVPYKEKYGLRVGVDLSKPLRSLLDKDYQGFQILGDYRIYDNYYLAAELGNEQNVISEANITASGKGSYMKIGANYNAYHNWQGMQNVIYVGLRYGFSSFSTQLENYSIYTTDSYFPPDIRSESQNFKNLTASWIELQLGVKVEILNNLYLGAHVELKRRISQTQPTNFDNLYIPGFNRTYDDGTIGTGVGYSISYLIPLYKK